LKALDLLIAYMLLICELESELRYKKVEIDLKLK